MFVIIGFLISCTPDIALDNDLANEPTKIQSTKEPSTLQDVVGELFFDINGNGLHEKEEPSIPDFTICVENQLQEWICTETDSEGKFIFNEIFKNENAIWIKFEDPNVQIPERAFNYVNIWKGLEIIPKYELNGVSVPEQELDKTELVSIENTIELVRKQELQIGLVQGIVTMPLQEEGFKQLEWVMGFDQNPVDGVIDFMGETNECFEFNDCNARKDSLSPYVGTGESHRGIDIGTLSDIRGIPIFASHPGYVTTFEGTYVVDGKRALCIAISEDENWSFGKSSGITTSYQHLDNLVVEDGDYVERGQFLGFVGDTGGGWVHLHFEAWYGSPIKYDEIEEFYNKDFYAMNHEEHIIPGFNDMSIWTEWNTPHYINIETNFNQYFAYKPTPTVLPSSKLDLIIDGNSEDWSSNTPLIENSSNNSINDGGEDLVSYYSETDENFLFIMISSRERMTSKEAQIDVLLDIEPEFNCDGSEIGLTIQQEALPSYWDATSCISGQNPHQIIDAEFKWGNVIEVKIPLHYLGDFEYIEPAKIHLNIHGESGWYTADSLE